MLTELLGLRIRLPRERMKALADARKKAREDGKKGKALRDAIDEAVKLTDKEKTH